MASYIVYEKPGLPLEGAIESAVLVKNHYSALAFFFPVIWMLVKRLWWVLLGYLLFMIPLWSMTGVIPVWCTMLVTLLVSLWVAVEAPTLLGWSLRRDGYVEYASLFAEDRDHCEQRYVAIKLDARGAQDEPSSLGASSKANQHVKAEAQQTGLRHRMSKEPVIGLFPVPDASQEIK